MSAASIVAEISANAYDYDELDRRTKNTFQDGSRWEYGYDDLSQVISVVRKTSGSTDVPQLAASYSYDGIGNRLTSNSPVLGNHTYTPNSLNQYSSVTTSNGRTAVGRAPVAWTVQVAGTNAGRIGEFYYRDLTATNTSAPVWQSVVTKRDTGSPTMTNNFWYAKTPTVPTYDLDGNLTNDGRWSFTWDGENRLIQVETTVAATTAGQPYTKLKFVYDWQGRRIARNVWKGGTVSSPTFISSRRWLYDDWNVIAEFSASSETTTTVNRLNTFTWGLDLAGTLQSEGGVGGLLVQTAVSGGVIEHASYDGNGNIVAWTKSSSSSPTSRREYDSFGNTVVSEGSAPSSFGFSTKMQDLDSGLYYYGYRYYDTIAGRWLSRDPIAEGGGFNLYAACSNNAVGLIDRWGLQVEEDERIEFPEVPEGELDFETPLTTQEELNDKADAEAILLRLCKMSPEEQNKEIERMKEEAEEKAKGGEDEKEPDPKEAYPKSPRGPGTVPPALRDPKRVWTPAENQAKWEELCRECSRCRLERPFSLMRGHHIIRHADGGQTDDANHDILCEECHKEVHSK